MKEGWKRTALGDVLQQTETLNPLGTPNSEFHYIDVSSVSNETFCIEQTQRLRGKDAPSRARRRVKANDVLFATVRPTLRRIAIVPEELDSQICSTGYFVLRPKPGLDHRFLFYFLFTETFIGRMEQLQRGASYPAVTDSDVRTQPFLFPQLAEQKHIVAILDKAFAAIATAKANAEKNLQNARALFESHLEYVFTHRRNKWAKRSLGELSELISGQHIDAKDYNTDSRGVGYLTGPSDFGFVNPTITKWTEHPKRMAQNGDILITVKGSGVGKINLLDADEVAISRQLMAIRTTSDNVQYIYAFLSTQFGYFQSLSKGAAIPGISREDVLSLMCPLPPSREKQAIVETILSMSSETQRLESIYRQKLAALEEMKKSLLAKAFSGELTMKELALTDDAFPATIPNITTTDLHAGLIAIAYQSHEQKSKQDTLGHVKAEKIAHMVEAHLGIDLGRTPVKDAAGPNDYPHLKRVEHRSGKAGFFTFQGSERAGYKFVKGRNFDGLTLRTRLALGARNQDVDRLIELMTPMDSEQAEIFSTVYAAWNNLLLDQRPVTDKDIVLEARENWHPEKLKIPRERFFKAIAWMKANGVVPKGKGRKVSVKAD